MTARIAASIVLVPVLLATAACPRTETTLCATGIRCPADRFCAAGEPACITTPCGNGALGEDEECDDGNARSGDGCSELCMIEFCGNGTKDAGEECDHGGESAMCDLDCTMASCDDGTVNQTRGEACDDGDQLDGDGCSSDCRSTEQCGNGILDTAAGETCDCGSDTFAPIEQHCDGQQNALDHGYCRVDCQLHCGDGEIDLDEECDDARAPEGFCTDFFGFDMGSLGCSSCDRAFDNCVQLDWSPMPSGTTASLNGVWGSGPDDVFAVGDGGVIVHYNGDHWLGMDSNTNEHLNAVWGSGPDNVIAVGNDGVIVRWDSWGWSPMPSPTSANWVQIFCGRKSDRISGTWILAMEEGTQSGVSYRDLPQ